MRASEPVRLLKPVVALASLMMLASGLSLARDRAFDTAVLVDYERMEPGADGLPASTPERGDVFVSEALCRVAKRLESPARFFSAHDLYGSFTSKTPLADLVALDASLKIDRGIQRFYLRGWIDGSPTDGGTLRVVLDPVDGSPDFVETHEFHGALLGADVVRTLADLLREAKLYSAPDAPRLDDHDRPFAPHLAIARACSTRLLARKLGRPLEESLLAKSATFLPAEPMPETDHLDVAIERAEYLSRYAKFRGQTDPSAANRIRRDGLALLDRFEEQARQIGSARFEFVRGMLSFDYDRRPSTLRGVLREVLALDPTFAQAHFAIGIHGLDGEELDIVLDAYSRAARYSPANPFIRTYATWARARLQGSDPSKTDAIRSEFRRLQSVAPSGIGLYYEARWELAFGDFSRARNRLSELRATGFYRSDLDRLDATARGLESLRVKDFAGAERALIEALADRDQEISDAYVRGLEATSNSERLAAFDRVRDLAQARIDRRGKLGEQDELLLAIVSLRSGDRSDRFVRYLRARYPGREHSLTAIGLPTLYSLLGNDPRAEFYRQRAIGLRN